MFSRIVTSQNAFNLKPNGKSKNPQCMYDTYVYIELDITLSIILKGSLKLFDWACINSLIVQN